MALLPDRHPQKDFFVLDISDVVPKDDTASMEHPLFSLATKPDMRHLTYGSGENSLTITPSGLGLPTIFDKDILIFVISQLMHRKNRGEPIGKRVRFSARELSIATNRPIGGNHYKRLDMAFRRLMGTTFKTTIRTGGRIETRYFTLIESGSGFVQKADTWRLDFCEVILSDWLMAAIESGEVLTISPDYFRLRRPLERRLYEIARKHCGYAAKWEIDLAKLQAKTGSNAPLFRFRFNLREIIREDVTPFYRLELTESDTVVFRPRQSRRSLGSRLVLPGWAEDKGREIAHRKGWDFYGLLSEWQDFARSGEPPDNPGAAFVGFCKRKPSLR